MRVFKTISVAAACVVMFAASALRGAEGDLLDVRDSQDDKIPTILDTDIGGDIDDAFALALIHRFADRGACELLGVTLTTDNAWSARFVAAENAAFGRPNVPVGLRGNRTDIESYASETLAQKNADGTPEYPVPEDFQPEDPVALLRRLLANAKDHSVVIVQVGGSTNLAALLDSHGDEISPLTGKELAAQKVRLVSVMGGAWATDESLANYGGTPEWNIKCDIPSAQKLTNEWPGEVVFSGYEVGDRVRMSPTSLKRDYRSRRAKLLHDAYVWWTRRNTPVEGMDHERPTWDLTAVLFVMRPEDGRGYYRVSESGSVTFDDKGVAAFTPKADGKRRLYLLDQENCVRVREAFVNLCSEP